MRTLKYWVFILILTGAGCAEKPEPSTAPGDIAARQIDPSRTNTDNDADDTETDAGESGETDDSENDTAAESQDKELENDVLDDEGDGLLRDE